MLLVTPLAFGIFRWHLDFGKSVDPCVSHKIISDVSTLQTRKSLWDEKFYSGADKIQVFCDIMSHQLV